MTTRQVHAEDYSLFQINFCSWWKKYMSTTRVHGEKASTSWRDQYMPMRRVHADKTSTWRRKMYMQTRQVHAVENDVLFQFQFLFQSSSRGMTLTYPRRPGAKKWWSSRWWDSLWQVWRCSWSDYINVNDVSHDEDEGRDEGEVWWVQSCWRSSHRVMINLQDLFDLGGGRYTTKIQLMSVRRKKINSRAFSTRLGKNQPRWTLQRQSLRLTLCEKKIITWLGLWTNELIHYRPVICVRSKFEAWDACTVWTQFSRYIL